MESTLLLNSSFEPLKVVSWQRAITMLFAGKVEVVEEYSRRIHSVTFSVKLPSVIRLLKYVRVKPDRMVKFSRVIERFLDCFSSNFMEYDSAKLRIAM